jgi:Transposase DDE domain group 1
LVVHRTHCETTYAAKSWAVARRVIARIEATTLGLDIRTIVTSLKGSTPERLYEFDYCDRGRAENLIKLHKTQLRSDRTSCMSAAANQMRLMLHTAAYWLLWAVQQAVPDKSPLKRSEFGTLQIRLVKIGARIIETASRIRIAFASACPDKALIAHLVRSLCQSGRQRSAAP